MEWSFIHYLEIVPERRSLSSVQYFFSFLCFTFMWGTFFLLNFIFLYFAGKAQWLHLVQELPTLALQDQAPPVVAYSTITTATGRARLWYVQPHPQLVQVAVTDRKSTMLPILTVQAVSLMLATSIMFQAVAMGVEGILVMAIQTRNSLCKVTKTYF